MHTKVLADNQKKEKTTTANPRQARRCCTATKVLLKSLHEHVDVAGPCLAKK